MISTFSSAFAQTERHVPFLFKRLQSPPSVNVQFFVRAKGAVAGRNPYIDSILVRSLTYEFPEQAPVLLVKNHASGFWQQGREGDESEHVEPLPCFEGWYIRTRFDLMLNGRNFTGVDTLFARKRTKRYPLYLEALR